VKTGVQEHLNYLKLLDSGFRRNDVKRPFWTPEPAPDHDPGFAGVTDVGTSCQSTNKGLGPFAVPVRSPKNQRGICTTPPHIRKALELHWLPRKVNTAYNQPIGRQTRGQVQPVMEVDWGSKLRLGPICAFSFPTWPELVCFPPRFCRLMGGHRVPFLHVTKGPLPYGVWTTAEQHNI